MREEHENDMSSRFKSNVNPEQLLKIIFDYAAKIANTNDLDKVLKYMADMGREMIVADRCSVWLLDRARNELWTRAAHGVDEIRMPADRGLVGYAVKTGKPIFIDDAYTNDEYSEVLKDGALKVDQQTGYRTKAIIVVPFRDNDGEIFGAYQAVNKLTSGQVFSDKDLEYISLAASYSGKSLESVQLLHEIEETQKEIIFTMGAIGESRSKETGNHVKRVAEYSYILALGLGMSKEEAELLRMASPMHDIGKVGIPDSILKKPGKLTDEEFEIMKAHTDIGYNLLKHSRRRILKAAAIVASEHHEKWNGRGYPNGLKGEEIHIYGRITAIADVFDALSSDRVYKKAWDLDRILQLLKEERGEHFDPRVVDVFFDKLPHILAIRNQYSDVISGQPEQ